jgi:predicted TIM-barrel fold metal-dependent hydrolase
MKYRVIDGDGHIIFPSEDWWKPYTPKKYWDWMPHDVTEPDGKTQLYFEGKPAPSRLPSGYNRMSGDSGAVGLVPGGFKKFDTLNAVTLAEARRMGGANPKDRLTAMDEDKVDIAYLYPSQILSVVPALSSSAFALAMCQAYNDWLYDFCSADLKRLRPVALVPQQDTVLAVEEMERARKRGFSSVMLRPNPINGMNIDHPSYDRIWAAAQDLNMAIGIHEGWGMNIPEAGVDRCHTMLQGHIVCHPFEHMLACLLMITGGIMERFPKMRVGFMESGAGWAPYWLIRMDEHFEKLAHQPSLHTPKLKERPSETFKRQCYLGVEPDDEMIPYMIERGLEDTLIFSSDFPHFDAIFPGSVDAMAKRQDMSDQAKRKALHDNSVRFYDEAA